MPSVSQLHQNKDDIQLSTKLTTTLTRIEETIISQVRVLCMLVMGTQYVHVAMLVPYLCLS